MRQHDRLPIIDLNGPGSGIGPAHRYGATLDGEFELTAGCFSRDGERNAEMAHELSIASDRVYADFKRMAEAEASRADGIDAVAILTPNDSHAPACLAFLDHGINVICEKPLATSVSDALAVYRAGQEAGRLVALCHTYASYAMVHEARARVAAGHLGRLRLVQVEYTLGARSCLVEAEGDEKVRWRMTPDVAGPFSTLGDIGSHAHHLARFITGLEVAAVSADIQTFVDGRTGDDNAQVNLRFDNGARGHLWASTVAAGLGNGLCIRVFGDSGSLSWRQERPDELWLRPLSESPRLLRRGEAGLSAEAQQHSRFNLGQPQGVVEAFANFYRTCATEIRSQVGNERLSAASVPPTAYDGVLGMKFIESCVQSHRENGRWVNTTVDFTGAGHD